MWCRDEKVHVISGDQQALVQVFSDAPDAAAASSSFHLPAVDVVANFDLLDPMVDPVLTASPYQLAQRTVTAIVPPSSTSGGSSVFAAQRQQQFSSCAGTAFTARLSPSELGVWLLSMETGDCWKALLNRHPAPVTAQVRLQGIRRAPGKSGAHVLPEGSLATLTACAPSVDVGCTLHSPSSLDVVTHLAVPPSATPSPSSTAHCAIQSILCSPSNPFLLWLAVSRASVCEAYSEVLLFDLRHPSTPVWQQRVEAGGKREEVGSEDTPECPSVMHSTAVLEGLPDNCCAVFHRNVVTGAGVLHTYRCNGPTSATPSHPYDTSGTVLQQHTFPVQEDYPTPALPCSGAASPYELVYFHGLLHVMRG